MEKVRDVVTVALHYTESREEKQWEIERVKLIPDKTVFIRFIKN